MPSYRLVMVQQDGHQIFLDSSFDDVGGCFAEALRIAADPGAALPPCRAIAVVDSRDATVITVMAPARAA